MLDVVRRSWPLVLFWAVLGALVLNSVAFFVPRQYSAVSQVLLIARDRNGVDPYTQAKSAERIGENLARVMQTSDFFDKVMTLPETSFDKNVWKNLDERAERRKWQRDVKAVVVYNTSLLKITTHAASKEEVVRLSNAIAQTLTAHGWEYIGGDVVLKQVDTPLVSRLPARPDFVITTLAGLLLGGLLCGVWLTYYKKRSIFG